MLEELPDDLMFRLGYRMAYGEAARLAEMATFDHGSGPDFAAGVGGEADSIEKELIRRLRSHVHPELIKPAVLDVRRVTQAALVKRPGALAGRCATLAIARPPDDAGVSGRACHGFWC